LETAISEGHEFATGGNQTGKHVTPTWKDNGGAPASDPSSNERILYNNAGEMLVRDNGGNDHHIGGVPSGTKMFFKQNSAPAGWTFASEDNDRTLLNTSTEAEGGDTGGSWTISGLTHAHTHDYTEVPRHRHSAETSEIATNSGYWAQGEANNNTTFYTDYTGSATCTTEGASTESVSSDASWRPSYVKVITCTKD
jgi:hypothetical protein